jgi:dephospho-CoA kinase
MLQVRANEGPAVVAKRMVPRIEASPSSTVIVEGVRSPDELAELRSKYEVATVAIHSSPKTRLQRLLSRNRTDDPHNLATFNERDNRELGVGLGDVIALADIVLVNEGTVQELQSAFKEALAKLGAR